VQDKLALKADIKLIQAPHQIPSMWDLILCVSNLIHNRFSSHFAWRRLFSCRVERHLCACVCVCLHCMSICLSASDFYSIKPVACAIGTRVIIWQNTWL